MRKYIPLLIILFAFSALNIRTAESLTRKA